jgi:hypothetical protein
MAEQAQGAHWAGLHKQDPKKQGPPGGGGGLGQASDLETLLAVLLEERRCCLPSRASPVAGPLLDAAAQIGQGQAQAQALHRLAAIGR